MNRSIVLFLLGLFCSLPTLAQNKGHRDFDATLSKHLQAISDRNLSAISATIADSVTLIFPNGEVLRSKQSFIDFHKNWFEDRSWKMTTFCIPHQN